MPAAGGICDHDGKRLSRPGQAAAGCGQNRIVLGGGCLMNAVLTEGLVAALEARGLRSFLPNVAPANDGGLSLGQAAMARAHLLAQTGAHGAVKELLPCA
jgi:hydrogenase maturation protein HypF